MVTFNSRPVTVIRHPGTPEERRWDTRMGGDLDTTALFQASDTVVTGDEIHCDVFDQPRVVLRTKPVFGSGELAYWEAAIIPRSEWNSLHSAKRPVSATEQTSARYSRNHKRPGRKPGTEVDAKRLKQYRGNWSQEEFADKCGVSVDTIQRGEAGHRWGDKNFALVAKAIELLTGQSCKPENLKNRTNRKN